MNKILEDSIWYSGNYCILKIWSKMTGILRLIRPVTLLAAKENIEKIRHLMDTYINPFVASA